MIFQHFLDQKLPLRIKEHNQNFTFNKKLKENSMASFDG